MNLDQASFRLNRLAFNMSNTPSKPADSLRQCSAQQPEQSWAAARLEVFLQQCPLGIIVWDTHGRVVEWSAASPSIFGYTAEEAIGGGFDLIVPADDLPNVMTVWASLLAQSGGDRSANRNKTKEGRSINCEWFNAPLLSSDGRVVGVASLVQDVTDTTQAIDAMRRSEARFRELIERSPDAILVVRAGKLIYANPALVSLLGHDEASGLLGQTLSSLMHPDDLRSLDDGLDVVPITERNTPKERRFIRRDGLVLTVEVASLVVEYDSLPAQLYLLRDLTERKLMQAKLLQADRMVSVGMLAAGVAHEINNPLAYLIANLETISSRMLPSLEKFSDQVSLAIADGELPKIEPQPEPVLKQIREMVTIAREGADRVRRIVQDLKAFSRGDDERKVIVDLQRILDATISIVWNEIRHRAELVRSYGDIPVILANESRVGQVFLNLLLNAAQALPIGEVSSNRIRVVTSTSHQGEAVVEVSDSGPGIPPEVLKHVFDPFFTTKPEGEGTGLGLWVCQGIVTSLGGSIQVETAPEQGTTFRVVFPAATAIVEARDERPLPVPVSTHTTRGRVLVVDDEIEIGHALAGLLGDEFDVVCLASGREAIAHLEKDKKFSSIICDLMMPDVSGMDVGRYLYAKYPSLAQRAIFVTGGAFSSEAEHFLREINPTLVEKPLDFWALRMMIRERHNEMEKSLSSPP